MASQNVKQKDGLFLLEVLIDKIVFAKSPCFSDKDFRTCVLIECPTVDPLEICDDEAGSCSAKNCGPFVKNFNNGKSCLFSLKESDINKAMSKFPIKLSVYKSLPCGCLPTKIVMGEATIDMTKEFVEARNQFLEDPNNVSYQALKDSFRLVGQDGAETGEIVMFLRISCFGKHITTRFQGAGGLSTIEAGGASSMVDRSYNPRREFQSVQESCTCGANKGHGGGPEFGSGPKGAYPKGAYPIGPYSTYHVTTSQGADSTKSDAVTPTAERSQTNHRKDSPSRACGAAGGQRCGAGFGTCPIAKDPYNSMPCQDPDDPCFCSGPKPAGKQQMACRNTDQYCLHVPKGILLNLPVFQVLTEEQKRNLKLGSSGGGDTNRPKKLMNVIHHNRSEIPSSQATQIVSECLQMFIENIKFPPKSFESESDCRSGTSSLFTLKYKKRSVSFCDTVDCVSRSQSHSTVDSSEKYAPKCSFGAKETAVYMTLCDDFYHQKCSGTQATAFINKCMQVSDNVACKFKNLHRNTNYTSSISSVSRSSKRSNLKEDTVSSTRYSDVYFFERKNKREPDSGMGNTGSKFKSSKSPNAKTTKTETGTHSGDRNEKTTGAQTKTARGSSRGTCTAKAVCIKENKDCKDLKDNKDDKNNKDDKDDKKRTNGDMVATVSHIRIGPNHRCPVHGSQRCGGGGRGMKCIVASSENGMEAPVKVSTVTNPRRGVFELVIRRMSGAPLAKNELMLEWTPPPSRAPPCCSPCPIPVWSPPGPCRPSKCKMLICRPSPCRSPCRVKCGKSKCCKRSCKKPCGPIPCPVPCSTGSCGVPCRTSPCGVPCRPTPCGPITCRKCCKPSCCGKPCRSRKPCPPLPRCTPCPPSPCAPRPCAQPCSKPCCNLPCSIPCQSSPCLRLCPVGRRKPRRCRSQPRIRAHRKRISPCCNREKFCPVVRCQSVPSPCITCCAVPACPPRRCRSIFPFKPKCCKSACSTCCA